MSVCGDKVRQPLLDHPFGHLLALRPKCPGEAAGRDLHQTALLDQPFNELRVFQKPLVALRMRQDADDAGLF